MNNQKIIKMLEESLSLFANNTAGKIGLYKMYLRNAISDNNSELTNMIYEYIFKKASVSTLKKFIESEEKPVDISSALQNKVVTDEIIRETYSENEDYMDWLDIILSMIKKELLELNLDKLSKNLHEFLISFRDFGFKSNQKQVTKDLIEAVENDESLSEDAKKQIVNILSPRSEQALKPLIIEYDKPKKLFQQEEREIIPPSIDVSDEVNKINQILLKLNNIKSESQFSRAMDTLDRIYSKLQKKLSKAKHIFDTAKMNSFSKDNLLNDIKDISEAIDTCNNVKKEVLCEKQILLNEEKKALDSKKELEEIVIKDADEIDQQIDTISDSIRNFISINKDMIIYIEERVNRFSNNPTCQVELINQELNKVLRFIDSNSNNMLVLTNLSLKVDRLRRNSADSFEANQRLDEVAMRITKAISSTQKISRIANDTKYLLKNLNEEALYNQQEAAKKAAAKPKYQYVYR